MSRGGARAGAGRPKGVPNQTTIELKNAVIEAFEKAGGADYLLVLAKSEPKTFISLLTRCIPLESKIENRNAYPNDLAERINARRNRVAKMRVIS